MRGCSAPSSRIRGDTARNFSRSSQKFGCAYNNVNYTDGETYRGRSIDHAMGGDRRMLSFGALYVDGSSHFWNGLPRPIESNREGPNSTHAVTPVPMDLTNIELFATRGYDFGTIPVGLGWGSVDESPEIEADDEVRGFVEWRRE